MKGLITPQEKPISKQLAYYYRNREKILVKIAKGKKQQVKNLSSEVKKVKKVKIKTQHRIPNIKPSPLSLYLHRMQRNYTILSIRQGASSSLHIVQMRNNIQEHGLYQKENFRITTKTLELEGIQLWGAYNIEPDIVLKAAAEAYANGLANAIAVKYGLVIGQGLTRGLEVEQTGHPMAKKIKGKGLIPIHWNKEGKADLWTDLSFGFRGLESSAAEVIAKMTELASDAIDNDMWNIIKEVSKNNTLAIQKQVLDNEALAGNLNEIREIILQTSLDVKTIKAKLVNR